MEGAAIAILLEGLGNKKMMTIRARLIDLCGKNNLKDTNWFLERKEICKLTWTQKTRNMKSIIYYVTVRQDSQVKTKNVRVYRGPCWGTDCYLVKAAFCVPPRLLMERLKDERRTIRNAT
jgi:hypothetical protein